MKLDTTNIIEFTIAFCTMIFLIFKYLQYKKNTKKAINIGYKIEKNRQFAKATANQLTSLLISAKCDTINVYRKLSSLKYELEINFHRIYKCYEYNPNSFILVTSYEYLNTEKENSVEKLYLLLYKLELNENTETISIYTKDDSDSEIDNFTNSFVKVFFKQFIET